MAGGALRCTRRSTVSRGRRAFGVPRVGAPSWRFQNGCAETRDMATKSEFGSASMRSNRLATLAVVLTAAACTRSVHVGSSATATADRKALLLDPSNPEWQKPAPPVSHLRFETSKGVFVLEVNRDWGPIGADRLYNLARLGYYDDTRFHRVNKDYIVQFGLSGDPAVNAAWRNAQLKDDAPRSENVKGTFAFSYMGPGKNNTRLTQIYVNLADNSKNNAEPFTVLGRVASGMDVLESLYSGYGENSGSGMRQLKQGPLAEGGNAFVDRAYPLLDRIKHVSVSTVR